MTFMEPNRWRQDEKIARNDAKNFLSLSGLDFRSSHHSSPSDMQMMSSTFVIFSLPLTSAIMNKGGIPYKISNPPVCIKFSAWNCRFPLSNPRVHLFYVFLGLCEELEGHAGHLLY